MVERKASMAAMAATRTCASVGTEEEYFDLLTHLGKPKGERKARKHVHRYKTEYY